MGSQEGAPLPGLNVLRASIWMHTSVTPDPPVREPPNIDSDITRVAQECTTCSATAAAPPRRFSSWSSPTAPWQRLHMDFAGPIEGRYLLILVDAHSKWVEVDVTSSTSSRATVCALRQHVSRFGLFSTLVTDNASCFTSAEFYDFTSRNGIRHLTIAPYHPASNGTAERSVRTVKSSLAKISGGTSVGTDIINRGLDVFRLGTLEERLARLLMAHRRTPTANGLSPSELLFGRNIITRLDLCHPGTFTKGSYSATGLDITRPTNPTQMRPSPLTEETTRISLRQPDL